VVTDLEMPEMNGIELTNELRKKYSREQLAIIGISGAENGSHSARFIKNGADDFLRKPFCPEEFYCRITQNIESLNNITQIQHAANTDYLTDLSNRRAFFHNANQRIAEYSKRHVPHSLAVLDIDHFKKVNDIYGHDVGDQVLKVFALYMRKHFGSGDTEISITVSLGVVFDSNEELSKQMNEADNALYLAKDHGRNQIVISGAEEH